MHQQADTKILHRTIGFWIRMLISEVLYNPSAIIFTTIYFYLHLCLNDHQRCGAKPAGMHKMAMPPSRYYISGDSRPFLEVVSGSQATTELSDKYSFVVYIVENIPAFPNFK